MSIARRARMAVAACTLAHFFAPDSSVAAQAQPARAATSIAALVAEAAHRFAIPQAWIYAVIHVESGGEARAVSRKGAAGLMQIMPATWDRLRVRYLLGPDIFERRDNIMAGAAYLRELYDRYGAPGFLAAYNAGPGRYEEYLSAGRPLPAETVAYVGRLAPLIDGDPVARTSIAAADPRSWTRAALFAGRTGTSIDSGQAASDAPAVPPSRMSPRVSTGIAAPARTSLFVPLSGPYSR
jgi:soluble lytic murein transglycosylase-like protein